MKRVKLEGTVRYANGRPASNRLVGFVTPKTAEFDGNVQTLTDDQGALLAAGTERFTRRTLQQCRRAGDCF